MQPQSPCYAVIFSSRLEEDHAGYAEAADRMEQLATKQPGFLGIESVRDQVGDGISVSYWRDEDSIRAWKRQVEHLAAQEKGRAEWYARYSVKVARVERAYDSGGESK